MRGPPKLVAASTVSRTHTSTKRRVTLLSAQTSKGHQWDLRCAAIGRPRSGSSLLKTCLRRVAPVMAPTPAPAEPVGRGIDDDVDAGAADAGADAAHRTRAQ